MMISMSMICDVYYLISQKLVEFVRKHDKRVELARQKQAERNAAIKKKVEEQRRQTILRNLE
jgi:hypothetical protein